MDIQVLVDYFKEGKKRGFTVEQLKNSLIQQGHRIKDIIEAIQSNVEKKIPENIFKDIKLPSEEMKKTKGHNPLIFIIGGVLVLVLILALVFMNLEKNKVNNEGGNSINGIEIPKLPPLPSGRELPQNNPINVNPVLDENGLPKLPPLPSN